jgi:uncharacterized membrane protein
MATMTQVSDGRRQETDVGPLQTTNGHSRWSDVNVGETERLASIIGGGALAIYGLNNGGWLGLALAVGGGMLVQRGLTGHCACYEAFGVSSAEEHGPATSVAAGKGVKVEKTVTINETPEKLYQFWRNLENLPRFMHHLESVSVNGSVSHWVARGPLGTHVEWDATIINDRENELIAWQSLQGSTVDNAGSVHFTPAPGGRGTEVKVILKYDPPAGKAGAFVARLFGKAPEQEIKEELRHFKQLMETGEVITEAVLKP